MTARKKAARDAGDVVIEVFAEQLTAVIQRLVANILQDHGEPLTVEQAAKRLGIGPTKTYELIHKRKLAHLRVEGKILIEAAEIDRYLKACRVPATT